MNISCRLCSKKFASALTPEAAQQEVLQMMAIHLAEVHKDEARMLGTLLKMAEPLFASYLLIRKYVQIPPDASELQQSFEQNERELLELFDLLSSRPVN